MYKRQDLTSLRLCNAEQKLELERLAGLYDEVNGSLDPAYYYKLDNIRRGVYTDWPLSLIHISCKNWFSISDFNTISSPTTAIILSITFFCAEA